MDERELEQRLRTAVEHAAPDPLDRILAACGPQAGTVLPFEAPKKKRRWAPLAVAAALVVMCCGAFGISSWRGANAVDSVVMLDVNPSLSMTVSSKERVLSVTPFNQDAEVILGDMDLTGTDLDVAVNALIGSMLQNGYLSDIQNAILVSVENQDAAKSAQLQQHLTDTINSVFQGGSLEGAVLSQTVTESADLNALAQQYGISVGKASLIQEVIAQDSTLTFASLAPLSVNEIALIAESRHLTTQAVTQTGTASTKAYITAEEAKNAALAHAGIAESSVAQLEIEFDSEDGLMVYEVEFYAGGTEYDYDINARTGEVVNFSREGGISGGTTGSSGSYIGEAAATAAALTHAGVSEADTIYLRCWVEHDDGWAECYEVEFLAGTTEYQYEIDLYTGAVLKSERESHSVPASGSSGPHIGEAAAKSAALTHAGVSESDASRILQGLGVGTEYHYNDMATLDARLKVKVLLAQALFGNPDLLMMDEPTNNLDIDAVNWLEDFLLDFEGTVIVVSHDRHFLNTVCTHIVDIDYNKIKMYVGNYDFWYESSQLVQQLIKNQNKRNEEKIKELQDFISRFSANKSKSKQATARRKLLDKLTVEEMPASSRRYPWVAFSPDREVGKDILFVTDVSKTIDGVKVLDKVSFIVGHGDKIAFVGDNENAHTALFQILTGELEPDEGTVKWGQTATFSYFPKDNTKFFQDCDDNLVEWLRQWSSDPHEAYLRGFLGRMLFSGDEVYKPVKVLSGGEKVRCMLSRMMLSGANVLLLDQPTNHLDLESIAALNNGLEAVKCNVLFASHDHQLVQTVANRVFDFTSDGKLIDRKMTYDEYLESQKAD